jgi:hypothetical protein
VNDSYFDQLRHMDKNRWAELLRKLVDVGGLPAMEIIKAEVEAVAVVLGSVCVSCGAELDNGHNDTCAVCYFSTQNEGSYDGL